MPTGCKRIGRDRSEHFDRRLGNRTPPFLPSYATAMSRVKFSSRGNQARSHPRAEGVNS